MNEPEKFSLLNSRVRIKTFYIHFYIKKLFSLQSQIAIHGFDVLEKLKKITYKLKITKFYVL